MYEDEDSLISFPKKYADEVVSAIRAVVEEG